MKIVVLNFFRTVTEWKGWKWVYWLELGLFWLIIMLSTKDIIDTLTITTREDRIRKGMIPIPAECCWEFHSKTNAIISSLLPILFLGALFLISLRREKYMHKFLIITIPLFLVFFLWLLFHYFFPINL